MRYLRLYEAFESEKLSKVVSYIGDKSSRDQFISQLKSISEILDFPMSDLSDDFIQYLRYQRAINLDVEKGTDQILIKFWFTSDGKYLCTTLTDGVERKENVGEKKINPNDYVVDEEVSLDDQLNVGIVSAVAFSNVKTVTSPVSLANSDYNYMMAGPVAVSGIGTITVSAGVTFTIV